MMIVMAIMILRAIIIIRYCDPICDVPHSITDTQDPLGDEPDDIAEPEVSFRDDKAEQEGVIHKGSWS